MDEKDREKVSDKKRVRREDEGRTHYLPSAAVVVKVGRYS